MTYGFQLLGLTITRTYKHDPMAFDNAVFGKGGARGYLARVLAEIITAGQGDADAQRSTYFRINTAKMGGWTLYTEASGGAFGEVRDIVDTNTHTKSGTIAYSDAVLQQMTMVMVVPPYGDQGLLIAETRGRSHLSTSLFRRLNNRLKSDGLYVRFDHSVADSVAWEDFLSRDEVDVNSIELVQKNRSADRTNFGDNKRVSKATLTIKLSDDRSTKERVIAALRPSIKAKTMAKLTGVVGLTSVTDDDFDEQRVVYVEDGRERKLNVTAGWPIFTYPIDTPGQPSASEFLTAAQEPAADILRSLDINLQQAWWPREADLTEVLSVTAEEASPPS